MGKSKSMLIEFPSLNNILQKDVESWVAFLNCNFFQNCAPHWAIGQTIESAIWLSKVRKPLWYCRIYRLLLPCPSLQFQTSQRATMWRRSNSNSSPSVEEESISSSSLANFLSTLTRQQLFEVLDYTFSDWVGDEKRRTWAANERNGAMRVDSPLEIF